MNPEDVSPKIEQVPKREWSAEEVVDFYTNLLNHALAEIPEGGAAMVLGPMFIIRTPEENFALFEEAQAKLEAQGIAVFNQLPHVDYNLKDAPFQYDKKFEIFYKGLIQSGKITACYLLPGWEQSLGTNTEVEFARAVGVPVHEL
jgi:hypothetical protein